MSTSLPILHKIVIVLDRFKLGVPTKDHPSHFRHAALSVELGEGFTRKGNLKVWIQYKDF